MWDLWLTLRGMWFRRGVSLTVFVVASLVVGGAVTGPLFLRAAGESVLHDTLAQAMPVGRIVSDHIASPLKTRPLARVQRLSAGKISRLPALDRMLAPPVSSLQVQAVVGPPGQGGDSAVVAYRQDVCHHVRMVQGRCAQRSGTVMVSAKTSAALGWRSGQRLMVNGRPVTVSGLYAPVDPRGDYWGTHAYFASLSGSGMAGDLGSTVDALFAPRATLLNQPGYLGATAAIDRHLSVARLRVTDVPGLEKALLAYADNGISWNRNPMADISDTAIGSVLVQATEINHKLVLPVVVVEVQLLVLCWLILFLVVANAAEARGQEVSLAKLRGAPAPATVAFGLLDTLLLVVLAVPAGFALAWGWVTAMADLQLAPGTSVVLTPAAWWAAAGAGAGAVVAAVLAASRTLRRPVLEQWRRATRRAKARPWVLDGALVAATIAGLVVLARSGAVGTTGSTSVLALMVPGLLVLAAALLGSRILPGLCRAAFGSTRRNARLARFLAVRQLARRPTTLRLALILTVAFGLVTFGIDAWSVARTNEHDRAWTEIGAAKVLTVTTPAGADLGKIVDRLDPTGQQAAAVTTVTDYSRPTPIDLLAVQPDRFAHVAFWRSDFGPAPLPALMNRLTTHVAPPVPVSGSAVQVHLHVSRLEAKQPPLLIADIAAEGAGLTSVSLGAVRPGEHTLRGSVSCQQTTCHLAGLHLERPGTSFYPIRGRLVVTGIDVHDRTGWHDLAADLDSPAGWRAAGGGSSAASLAGGHGLVLTANASSAGIPGWRVADRPARLPALMTETARSAAGPHVGGLTSEQLRLDPIAVEPALPGAAASGVIVDRSYAIRAAHGSTLAASEAVWLAPSAVSTFPDRLRKAGVTILSSVSASHQTALYQRQGPALAILLFLAGAGLGAVLAAGGVVLNLHQAGRRRTYELAAMAALGLRRRALLLSLFLEQGLLLVFGIGVGLVAGIGGALLALPAVPEFADTPTAPPMLYGIHLSPVLSTAAGAVVALSIVIALSAGNLLRSTRFTQLREAPA